MADTAASTEQKERAPAAADALSDVAERVAELRESARKAPGSACDAAWTWFTELGREASKDRDGSSARLNELFRFGTPPKRIDGQTEGILVTPLIQPVVDRALRGITSLWMPWLGKRFDATGKVGDNTLTGSARWPSKLLWPRYNARPYGKNLAAFDFENRIEPGKNDPDREVLVIDYAPVDSNPNFVIRKIRDELVEIVPGANLGKILWRRDDDDYALIGFFALRSDLD